MNQVNAAQSEKLFATSDKASKITNGTVIAMVLITCYLTVVIGYTIHVLVCGH